jgi:hypothetical protein
MGTKKDLTRIIDKGTPMERINLYFSHRAERESYKPGLLTEEEVSRLRESFKTSREIDLFDKYVVINRDVQKTIIHLNQLQLAYDEQIAYIRGIEDLWYAYSGTAELLNKVLQRVKDEDIAEEMLNDIINSEARYPFEYATDKDGHIVLKTTSPGEEGETALEALTRIRRTLAERALKHAKPIFKAVYDYMREKGFKIKVYQRQLKAIEKDLMEDKAISKGKITPLPEIYPKYKDIELNEEEYKDYRETYFSA